MPEIYPASGTVQVGNSLTFVRAEPNTSSSLAGSKYLNPGVIFEVKGWCYGECVSGECRWWVSKYGNYVWAGATIQKPPGSPTSPAPREYKVSAPLVAFSKAITVTFYPNDKIEIRAFNVDDIAKVYVDDKLVLTVGYKGDQKVQINPGLSIGNHSIRLTVENTGGGWTYGFDVLKNGISVLSSPFKEGDAGVTGAKNNDLGVGLVVDIILGITISPAPAPIPVPTPEEIYVSPPPTTASPTPSSAGIDALNQLTKQINESTQTAMSTVATAQQSIVDLPLVSKIWESVNKFFDFWKDLFDKIGELMKDLKRIAFEMFDEKGWLWGIFTNLAHFLGELGKDFWDFIRDAGGKIKEWIGNAIGRVRDWLNEVWDDITTDLKNLWQNIKNTLERIRDEIAEKIIPKIEALWERIKNTIDHTFHEVLDPIGDVLRWIWDKMSDFYENHIAGPIRTILSNIHNALNIIDSTLSGIAIFTIEFFKTIKLLFTDPGEFFRKFVESVGDILSSKFFQNIYNSIRAAWDWLVEIYEKGIRELLALVEKLAPTAPEKGKDVEKQAIQLAKIGIGALGAFTGVSLAVSWLSKHHLGHLSAILYDMSSYKYITGAFMGALVTAAYAQPLKYFYNAKFRPYLPSFRDAFTAFSMNIIGKKGFQFHLKYAGIPDDYLELYERLADTGVSPYLLRGMVEAEITDPDTIFKYLMGRGYSLEKSINITGALMWLAVKDYRKEAENSVKKHLTEGYITFEEYKIEISKIRAKRDHPVSYSTIDGETYSGTVSVPLSHEELMKISSQWDTKYDRLRERESAIKSDLRSGDIDADTAIKQLSEFVKDESKINDIIRECIRELKTKEEPDRGKSIRTALKTQLRTCYKEGFINKERYDSERDAANKITDPNILEDMLAEWSAFYDDRSDQLKYFKDKAINKEITIDEFRSKMVEWGMRSSKIDLIVNDVVEKILVADRKQRAKLDSEIKSLRSKLRYYQDQLTSLESQIESETNPKKVSTLQAKYESTLAKASKVEEELSATEEELKSLAA